MIEAAKNSAVMTKAKNTLDSANIKETATKTYQDVVKTPIAKTQAAWEKKKDQLLDMPLPHVGLATAPLGPTANMTVREGIEAVQNTVMQMVGNKDGGGERNKDTDEVSNSNEDLSRIEYLHNKYGQFTTQELNYRINLRGAVEKELERLNTLGLTKNEIGPAVAGTFDKTTGKYYFGINNTDGDIPVTLPPIIKGRIYNMPESVKDGYKFTYGAGSHAEVYFLNQALLANPNALPGDFITHVVRSGKKLKPAGMMMPTCPHCNFITEGFEFSSEVRKFEK